MCVRNAVVSSDESAMLSQFNIFISVLNVRHVQISYTK